MTIEHSDCDRSQATDAPRKIIHIDMDAFYASVEQRDHPEWRGKPVVVGGSPTSRGVVATCSYEARRFGVHSAMASSAAKRLCPDAIFVLPRMEQYRQVSAQIMAIFRSYTDLVEPLSLDEAYLDVTASAIDGTINSTDIGTQRPPSATLIAREIKSRIRQTTRLTASAGVSYNKFIAKLASDYQKPNGLTVVRPEVAQAFLDAVSIDKFHGVGKVTADRFRRLGVATGKDLRRLTLAQLTAEFADRGRVFYDLVRGVDPRPVQPHRTRKSIGNERTLQVDIDNPAEMLAILTDLAHGVERSLEGRGVRARVVVLKLKFADFQQITRRATALNPVQSADEILHYVRLLLAHAPLTNKVRLLGVTVQEFVPDVPRPVQMTLF